MLSGKPQESVLPLKPIIGVSLLLRNANDEYLIMERIGSHEPNTFAFPGGKLEDETIENCAIREGMEELGIKLTNPKIVAFTQTVSTNCRFITFYVTCNYLSDVKYSETSKVPNEAPFIIETNKCKRLFWSKLEYIPYPHASWVVDFLRSNKRVDVNGWSMPISYL